MIFAIDAGNSFIVMGGLTDGTVTFTSTVSTDKGKTEDEYAILFQSLMDIRGIDSGIIEGAVISCVVPSLTQRLCRAVRQMTGKIPLIVGPGIKTGLNILLDSPGQMGSDIVSIAVGALGHYPLPCITVDMGTATILGVLDKQGNYIGGAICPSLPLSLDALTTGASQLPNISLDIPGRVIGRSTVECIQSGMLYGFAAMLDGMLDRMEAELGEPPTVVFTGAHLDTIKPLCKRKDILSDPHLILKGLWLIYEKNTKR